MQRRLTLTTLAAALAIGTCTTAFAAESPHRFRVVREPVQTDVLRVTKSGSTWFTGTDATGKPRTVVFLHRFATVERDGKRVPVSLLRSVGIGPGIEEHPGRRRPAGHSGHVERGLSPVRHGEIGVSPRLQEELDQG